MPIPRVLLIAGSPNAQDAGEIFLQDLCRYYPADSLCRFSLSKRSESLSPDRWLGFPMASAVRPQEKRFRRLGERIARLTSFLAHYWSRVSRTQALVSQVSRFGSKHQVDLVWAILSSPTHIYVARRVAAALDAPLVVMIWDPPEYLASELLMDSLSTRLLMSEFEATLHMAVRCGVASEGMRQEFRNRYGIDSTVLIHGIHPRLRRSPARGITSGVRFTVGFAGSLYALQEWQALLSALSSVDWSLEGRKVIVRVLGPKIYARVSGKAHIEYLGWHSLQETIELMSQVDVAYLPYWFDKEHQLAVRLCFPNKLTTYLAAGRPVLYHGPKDSSPTRFLQRFPAGLCCHSLDKTELVEILRRFVTDREFYARATQAGQEALDEELGLHVFLSRFASLLGIQESELLPIQEVCRAR